MATMLKSNRAPPIQHLVIFEVSARHSSFKAAAEELNVTPSAIGQQIKSLEELLGLRLFIRETRKIQLTSAGESFYKIAKKTLACYDEGFMQFKNRFYSSTLKISMLSYIANDVVIPRLHEFQESNPNIELIIETSTSVENLVTTDLDCAIRHGTPPWENCDSRLIGRLSYNFLASKKYFDENFPNGFSTLQDQTLIHIRSNSNDWQQLMDIFNFTPKKELHLSSYASALKAAEQGLGIVFGFFPNTNKFINEGKLVPLLPDHIPIPIGNYFVTRSDEFRQESYEVLHAWLIRIFSDL